MIKVAIVGSQGKHWTPVQRAKVVKKISKIFSSHAGLIIDRFTGESIVDFSNIILVSGGCGGLGETLSQKFDGGVDVWAEIVADIMGIKKDIKYSDYFGWADKVEDIAFPYPSPSKKFKGFKTRNLEIAGTCDVLYCIDPKGRRSGGMWTLERAEEMGKEVHLVEIE